MTNHTPIQVLSVGSSAESSLALHAFFNESPDLSLADAAANSAEALQKLNDKHIDVVLLELSSQDLDGIELTKQIRKSHSQVRVLISTASDTPADIFAAMDAGADGYVLNGNPPKGLKMAISSVKLGAVWLDPGIAKQVLEVMVTTASLSTARVLPTGLLTLPLMPHEKEILNEVAASDCVDGVCLVNPDFVRKLRRLARPSA